MMYAHVGEYLEVEFLEKYGISKNLMASAIGVHFNRIGEIVRGRRGITPDTDMRLCRFFDLPEKHFWDVQTRLDFDKTRGKIKLELQNIRPYRLFFDKK